MTSKLLLLMTLDLVFAPAAFAEQAQAQARTPQARIDAAMEAAARADVPVSLLTSKVAEGEAKHVPRERIAAAVETRLAALTRASRMLRRAEVEAQSPGELALMADALEAGVSENVVVRTWRSAPSDLVRLGQGSEPAFARVNAALRTNAALANLQAEVASRPQITGTSSTK